MLTAMVLMPVAGVVETCGLVALLKLASLGGLLLARRA